MEKQEFKIDLPRREREKPFNYSGCKDFLQNEARNCNKQMTGKCSDQIVVDFNVLS